MSALGPSSAVTVPPVRDDVSFMFSARTSRTIIDYIGLCARRAAPTSSDAVPHARGVAAVHAALHLQSRRARGPLRVPLPAHEHPARRPCPRPSGPQALAGAASAFGAALCVLRRVRARRRALSAIRVRRQSGCSNSAKPSTASRAHNLARSRAYEGSNARLKRVLRNAQHGRPVTIAVIGGSGELSAW